MLDTRKQHERPYFYIRHACTHDTLFTFDEPGDAGSATFVSTKFAHDVDWLRERLTMLTKTDIFPLT